MAAFDGAIKSLMQGVSQQVPRERLDGQVSLQVNMLSDLVAGIRRRPGARLVARDLWRDGGWNIDQIFATSVDVEDRSVHVMVNTADGVIAVYDDSFTTTLALGQFPYLIAPTAQSISAATLRGHMYLCNTSKKPVKVVGDAGVLNPKRTGYFFIKASLYSKQYSVTLTVGGLQYTASYTAPNGAGQDDASKATPEYVASQLYNTLVSYNIPGVGYAGVGPYIFISSPGQDMAVSTDAGTTYASASGNGRVTQVGDLPARLPPAANGMLMGVGTTDKNATWYKFSSDSTSWLETGSFGSATALSNMPIRLKLDGTYNVEQPEYEGRNAGSDDTNEDPPFIEEGITGMGVFQGRLVLLSGPQVAMSAAGKPLRFYRSTVSEVLPSDPIAIYSGAATSTNFTHAVQFNKDLLLFSKSCQAVVPAGPAAITPSTAQIVITSAYSSTNLCQPIVAGRSVLYFAPRSEKYASALELVPSTTTDSQYTTNDVTAHLPKYIPGTVRLATASTTSNSLVLVADGDPRTLFVQDYLWSGDEKVQSAWHTWTMPYDIVCTWFIRDRVYVGLQVGTALVVATVEPSAGNTYNGVTRPFSDLYTTQRITNRTFTVPAELRPAVLRGDPILITYADGELAGEWVGVESISTETWQGTVVRNTPDGVYALGLRYNSALSPTPPLMRDQNGVVIGTARAILVRYELSMGVAGSFNVRVQRNDEVLDSGAVSGVLWASSELSPNTPISAQRSKVVVPVRAVAQDTSTILYTDSEHDMNVLTIEYVMQYHALRRRA